MINHALYQDILCSEDIDTLRAVFDRLCQTHRRLRSDSEMESCASLMIRLYQDGERDPDALLRSCEASLLYRDVA